MMTYTYLGSLLPSNRTSLSTFGSPPYQYLAASGLHVLSPVDPSLSHAGRVPRREGRCRHFDVDINYKDNASEILDFANVE